MRSIRHVLGVSPLLPAFEVLAALIALTSSYASFGQALGSEIPIGVTYICNGEHIYVENCNIRDLSEANCMVAHPDHLTPTGLNSYTYVPRGTLKKLLPTCQQPSKQQLAATQAFQTKQQDLYNGNAQKADDQLKAAEQPVIPGQQQKPKTPEERALARCITAGRLPSSCTGNTLMGAFSQMVASVLPSVPGAKEPPPGPTMAGVFQGSGNWRLDFLDQGVLVNCAFLAPNQEFYTLRIEPGRTAIVINIRPKPLDLTLRADGSITGPGPITIEGVVPGGYVQGKTAEQKGTQTDRLGHYYDSVGNQVHDDAGYTTFTPRTATCSAPSLSSKGAGVGAETMQTDLLKSMLGGDKGPPTPPGLRMRGIFAASSGFSVQFFPESAVLGCGPDAARAYPYSVTPSGSKLMIHIEAPDHPLALALRPDGALDPVASGPYQVHGRVLTGQGQNDDFTFAPFEQTCELAALAPSKTIPESGGTGAMMTAAARPGASNVASTLSTPGAPLGNATLTIVSGFPMQPGVPNPLAGRPYVLLRDSYGDTLAKAGLSVPPGTSPYKYVGALCGTRSPDCQRATDAIKADAASAVRADANGRGTFPPVSPGTYYLMISTIYNRQPLVWGQAVQVNAGANSIIVDLRNATPLN